MADSSSSEMVACAHARQTPEQPAVRQSASARRPPQSQRRLSFQLLGTLCNVLKLQFRRLVLEASSSQQTPFALGKKNSGQPGRDLELRLSVRACCGHTHDWVHLQGEKDDGARRVPRNNFNVPLGQARRVGVEGTFQRSDHFYYEFNIVQNRLCSRHGTLGLCLRLQFWLVRVRQKC